MKKEKGGHKRKGEIHRVRIVRKKENMKKSFFYILLQEGNSLGFRSNFSLRIILAHNLN